MPKERCKFYVDYDDPPAANEDEPEVSQRDELVLPIFLPGEIVAARADNVLKFLPYTSQKTGISGILFCTNFRMCFVTSERDVSRSKLLGNHDVSLTNIRAIYQVVGDKVKRKLTKVESGTFTECTGMIVNAKDFSVHSFDFKNVKTEERKQIVNALMQMSYPRDHMLLFAHAYAKCIGSSSPDPSRTASKSPNEFVMPLLFCSPEDWKSELVRQGVTTDWRLTHVNKNFSLSNSMPEYFVVPSSITDDSLKRLASVYEKKRLPAWSFCTRHGNFLVVSPSLRTDGLTLPGEAHFFDELVKLRSDRKRKPLRKSLGDIVPSVGDLQASFEKLAVICTPETVSDFIKSDANFYSDLEATRWLEHVRTVLGECSSLAKLMATGQQDSIILEEAGGARDLSCVVSCLIQLMLDEGSRSIQGFQNLVQREWVTMGHGFTSRLELVHDKNKQTSPVFLFFLECVWRLTVSSPASFGFTDVYLVSLWDSALLGIFREFVFSSDQQRWQPDDVTADPGTQERRRLHVPPSVWHWELQFERDSLLDFVNPLYKRTEFRERELRDPEHGQSPWQACSDFQCCAQQKPLLWQTCHYRWLTPVQIHGGGEPPAFFRRCVLDNEATVAENYLRAPRDSADSSSLLSDSASGIGAALPHNADVMRVSPSSAAVAGPDENGGRASSDGSAYALLTSSYPFVKQALRIIDEVVHFTVERSASLSSLLEQSSAELDFMREDNIDD